MTENHLITPPPELVQQWRNGGYILHSPVAISTYVATRAAQWGFDQAKADIKRERQEAADQELEACIEVIADHGWFANPEHRMAELRAARRPKPQSLKEQSIALFDLIQEAQEPWQLTDEDLDVVRRALESIPDPS